MIYIDLLPKIVPELRGMFEVCLFFLVWHVIKPYLQTNFAIPSA